MKTVLQSLNKTPGVLGSAYLCGETEVADFGEAIGGAAALPLARRAADACRRWVEGGGTPLDAAVFVGTEGRLVVRTAGQGHLVAFAENDAAAGLLKMRMRDAAAQMKAVG
ncbi:MAG TPA: hypothetical protein VGM51_07520 [Armatimonadota bacterium]